MVTLIKCVSNQMLPEPGHSASLKAIRCSRDVVVNKLPICLSKWNDCAMP